MTVTNFTKYVCPKCGKSQLKPNNKPQLIISIECYYCGYIQQLTTILGGK